MNLPYKNPLITQGWYWMKFISILPLFITHYLTKSRYSVEQKFENARSFLYGNLTWSIWNSAGLRIQCARKILSKSGHGEMILPDSASKILRFQAFARHCILKKVNMDFIGCEYLCVSTHEYLRFKRYFFLFLHLTMCHLFLYLGHKYLFQIMR